jgi:hypothetical protein
VHEQQVDILGLELLEALACRADDVVVGEVTGPHLGNEEDLLAVHARVSYPASNLALVGVYLGGVDVPVAQTEGTLDGPDAFLPGEPPSA